MFFFQLHSLCSKKAQRFYLNESIKRESLKIISLKKNFLTLNIWLEEATEFYFEYSNTRANFRRGFWNQEKTAVKLAHAPG